MGTRRRNDVDATSLRRIDVVTTSCACWEFGPPKILNLGPPNILNLPRPMGYILKFRLDGVDFFSTKDLLQEQTFVYQSSIGSFG